MENESIIGLVEASESSAADRGLHKTGQDFKLESASHVYPPKKSCASSLDDIDVLTIQDEYTYD